MKVYTYHPGKSTGVGGVETLIREISKLSCNNKWKHIEIYHYIYGSELFENEISNKKKLPSFAFLKNDNLITIFRLLFFGFFSLRFYFLNNCTLLVSDIMQVYFIPRFILKKINLIVIQTTSSNLIFCRNKRSEVFFNKIKSCINRVVAYTEFDKDVINDRYNFSKDKVCVIPRGCKIKTAKFINNMKLEKNKDLIVISRLEERQKNFKDLIYIFDKLPSDFNLHIYGDGPESETEALKNKIKNNERITFHGSTSDVKAALNNGGIFLMTSFYEGFGQTLIEARSQGLPIVAFDTFPALSSIVIDDYNGYKIAPFKHDEFVKKIIYISSNINYFSQRSINLASETDMMVVNKKWIDLLRGYVEKY